MPTSTTNNNKQLGENECCADVGATLLFGAFFSREDDVAEVVIVSECAF